MNFKCNCQECGTFNGALLECVMLKKQWDPGSFLFYVPAIRWVCKMAVLLTCLSLPKTVRLGFLTVVNEIMRQKSSPFEYWLCQLFWFINWYLSEIMTMTLNVISLNRAKIFFLIMLVFVYCLIYVINLILHIQKC